MSNIDISVFKQQLAEDIEVIKDKFSYRERYNDDDYVFNHWILDKIYDLDEDILCDNITDQSGDCEIDCFVHYPDSKQLYIIQNKHYNASKISKSQLIKFINDPIDALDKGNYQINELQKAYKKAIDDDEYQIFFNLYSTQETFSDELYETVKLCNSRSVNFYCNIFNINDLCNIYYRGESLHGAQQTFSFSLKNIKEDEYLDFGEDKAINNNKFNAKYIAVSIVEIYNLIKAANDKSYNLFDENIRDYLGDGGAINKQIKKTLMHEEERKYFFFYNNGITLTSLAKKKLTNTEDMRKKGWSTDLKVKEIKLEDPQIINGCQTVNSIYEVLNNDSDNLQKYADTFVLMKVLNFKSGSVDKDRELYRKIVEATNSQNAVKITDFAKNNEYFKSIQEGFQTRGALLEVKRSDKTTFNKNLSKDKISKMLEQLRTNFDRTIEKKDQYFSIEKLILIYLCHIKDGQVAYTKKKDILNPNSEYFKEYSLKLTNNLTYDTLIRMYCLFIRAEKDKKIEAKAQDGYTYSPYYMFTFIGYLIGKEKENFTHRMSMFYDRMYQLDEDGFEKVYKYFIQLTHEYYTLYDKETGKGYNTMVKSPIRYELVDIAVNSSNAAARRYGSDDYILVENLLKGL